MKIKILLSILLLCFLPSVFAQEQIADFKEDSIPILNEELRKSRENIEDNVSNISTNTTNVTTNTTNIATNTPVGSMIIWPTDTAPTGWLLCYGQAVSQTTYASLYTLIGVTYGDPGGGNFNLPDLRGRIPLGQDDMGGVSANRVTDADADTLGGADGAETHDHGGTTGSHTLTIAQIPVHDHEIMPHASGITAGFGNYLQGAVIDDNYGTMQTGDKGGSGGHPHTITNASSLQPFITLNYIIKY